QGRQMLESGIALHRLERLEGGVLVARLELRDAEQQLRFRSALQAALGNALRQSLNRLVVLLIAVIREAEAHVLLAVARCGGLPCAPIESRLVPFGRPLGVREEALRLTLGTGIG